jgi:hypothetical protein
LRYADAVVVGEEKKPGRDSSGTRPPKSPAFTKRRDYPT